MTHDTGVPLAPSSDLLARRRRLFDAIILLDPVGLASTELHVAHLSRIAAEWPPGCATEVVGGLSVGSVCQAHAGAGTALRAVADCAGGDARCVRYLDRVDSENLVHEAPDAIRDALRSGLCTHIVMDGATADALMLVARVYVHSIWDHAVALAAEDGPMPIVADEPWAEGDEAFTFRLMRSRFYPGVGWSGRLLDDFGKRCGFPRVRLVPVED